MLNDDTLKIQIGIKQNEARYIWVDDKWCRNRSDRKQIKNRNGAESVLGERHLCISGSLRQVNRHTTAFQKADYYGFNSPATARDDQIVE